MRNVALVLCLLLTLSSFAQKNNKQANDRFSGIDAAFEQVLKDWHAAGFSVAVVEKDKIVYARGFGYRDYEHKTPVTTNTQFAIGSCTKAFTAALMGQLRKEGKVDFNLPVHLYFPELNFSSDVLNNTVTLRSMMSHTTGLPRYDYSWYFFGVPSRTDMLKRIQFMEPSAPINTKWQYNNFMYLAQGQLAEKLTGKSWEDNIRERFFVPLGMTSSNFSTTELMNSKDASIGYTVADDSLVYKLDYRDATAIGPAGSINSTVIDMAQWLRTWIHNGQFNGQEIIPESYYPEAISSQSLMSGGLPSKEKPGLYFSTYGFGWMLSSYKGHYRVEHGGNIDGFSATTAFFPTDSIGIVVLSNQSNSLVPAIVRNMITDRMLGLPRTDWNTDQKKGSHAGPAAANAPPNSKPVTTTSHPLSAFAGNYISPAFGVFTLTVRKDSLLAAVGTNHWWLKHSNYDVFVAVHQDKNGVIDTVNNPEMQDTNPFKLQFNLGITGEVESISIPLEPSLKPILFYKQPTIKEVSGDDLKKYVGEYILNGTTTTIKVYIKQGNILCLLVPEQPEYALFPVDDNKFGLKIGPGYFVQFSVSADAKVTDITFIQPNGNFKAIKQ